MGRTFTANSMRGLGTLASRGRVANSNCLFMYTPLSRLGLVLTRLFPQRCLTGSHGSCDITIVPRERVRRFVCLCRSVPCGVRLVSGPLRRCVRGGRGVHVANNIFRKGRKYVVHLRQGAGLIFTFNGVAITVDCLRTFPFRGIR